MPKKCRGKHLHKKRRGKDKELENEEIPGLNVATTNKSGSRVVDDAIPPSQNMIIDVGSQCTPISALTSSVASRSVSTVTDAILIMLHVHAPPESRARLNHFGCIPKY